MCWNGLPDENKGETERERGLKEKRTRWLKTDPIGCENEGDKMKSFKVLGENTIE